MNTDPATRQPETFAAIDAARREREHKRTVCSTSGRTLAALRHEYPGLIGGLIDGNAALLAENNRLRDAAGDAVVTLEGMSSDLVPLWSMKARLLLEAAEKLRAAMAR